MSIPVKITSRPQAFIRPLYTRRRNLANLIDIPITKVTNTGVRTLPSFLVFNARSILKKKEELEIIIEQCNPDVILITETWLADTVPDETVNIPKFNLIRKDRLTGRGGGVQIYVRENIPCKLRVDLLNDQYECLWIVLRPVWLPRAISRIAIACVYIPPSANRETLNNFYDYFCYCYDTLKAESPGTAVTAAGDFNPDSNGFNIGTITRQCRLKQVVRKPTRGNAILDLVITDMHKYYEEPEVLPPIGTSDHRRIVWKSRGRQQLGMNKKIKSVIVRPLRDANLRLFEQFIREFDWSPVFVATGIDDAVRIFLEVTNHMFDIFFPCKLIKVHEDDKPYITGRIKETMQKRDKAYQRGQIEQFKRLRNKIVSEIRKEKINYYDKKIKPTSSHNPKLWWKQIKRIVGIKQHAISIMDPETGIPLNAKETAEYINTFFTDLTKNYPEVSNEWLSMEIEEHLPQISVESLVRKLRVIDDNKASGPFDPNIKLIKLFAEFFAIPLTHIFNQSFLSMKFPDVWKISNVCSIPKVVPCSRVEDLRPISLTSVISKVQESYAVEWILEDVRGEISDSQFGGLAGSSAVLALVYLVHNWYKVMENTGKVVRISFLDFRKAYDLINHNKLLENFKDIGVRPALIKWFATYLQGRSQMCTFQNQQSELKSVRGGIPQGSKLGPMAFIIKINQLPMVVGTHNDGQNISSDDEDMVIFMDDTTLSEVIDVSNHSSGSPVGNGQNNIDKVVRFAENEQMEMNAKKCKEMIIDFRKRKTDIPPLCIEEQPMARVKSFKLLGLWMDSDLKWESNTEYIIKKAVKRLYLLKTLKSYGAPKNDLKTFYCAVIRSTLEYGAQVWQGNLTQAQRNDIERVQKRALRIIFPEYGYNRALQECNLKTLQERRDDLCIDLIKKMSQHSHKLHSLLPKKCSEVRERETRTNPARLYNYLCKTERFKRSPLVYAIDKYNSSLNL